MLPSWCTQVVTVIRPATKTQRGAVVPDWDAATSHQVAGCSVQPSSTAGVPGDLRVNPTASIASMYAPPLADIRRGDAIVEADGTRWLVDGDPEAWPHHAVPGRGSHLMVTLRRWQG